MSNTSYFQKRGIINLSRSINLMKNAIKINNLNLEGLVIFTEAASGEFIYSPILAAMAGAEKVYAITVDSKYGLKEDIKKDTEILASLCGVASKVQVVFDKSYIEKADIITNLGFVRPIDKDTIDRLKKGAVIPYMCEAWEVRPDDVDIDYCEKKNISVMGTNEDYPTLNVFKYSGYLALKMLFDAGIEVYKSKIVIISSDKFGKVIYDTLSLLNSQVFLIHDIYNDTCNILENADALIIADYTSTKCFIGNTDSLITAKKLKALSNFITVVQYAGKIDIDELQKNDISFYPNFCVGSLRMGKTLAYLGPRPIIDLHCAGLKVGELMYKHKKETSLIKLCQEIIRR